MSDTSQSKCVLLVDDEKDFRDIFGTKLRGAGFEIVEAANGKEALDALKTTKPDLIVMDCQMPEMNGIEAFLRIKEDPSLSHYNVLFMTNHTEPQAEMADIDKKFAKEIGAADFVKKADGPDAMLKRVQELCGMS